MAAAASAAAALFLEDALHREPHQRSAVRGNQCRRGLLLEHLMDAGQGSQGIHGQLPIGNGGKARMNRATGV